MGYRLQAKNGFHEDFNRAEAVKYGSDRSFGLTVGGIFTVIGFIQLISSKEYTLLAGALHLTGLPLLCLGFLAPSRLTAMNRGWVRLSLILVRITNPIFMALIFYFTVTPIAIVLRLSGKDPLRLKRDKKASTYWINRVPPGPKPDTMIHQF